MRRGTESAPYRLMGLKSTDMKTLLLALVMPMAAVAADFDVRVFNVVSDEELPDYRRHGAADWCRRPGGTNRFAEIR